MDGKFRNSSRSSRPFDENAHQQYVALLLERLTSLRRETDPAGGKSTAARKNNKAISAQILVGRLVHAVAGWAIDHQYGMALNGLETPLGLPDTKNNNQEYLDQWTRLDSHEHELNGADAPNDSIDPIVGRRLLLELLATNPGAFPQSLRQITVESLRELEYGRILPLLCPRKRWKKRGYREFQLQFEALGFVEYLRQRNKIAKEEAQAIVGLEFGRDGETIKKWESRLTKDFGRLDVEATLSLARHHAEWFCALRDGKINDDEIALPKQLYGEDALQAAGREYKQLLHAKNNPRKSRKPAQRKSGTKNQNTVP